MMKGFRSFFLNELFFVCAGLIVLLFILGFIFHPLFIAGKICVFLLLCFLAADVIILYSAEGIQAERKFQQKFSNGDHNEVMIKLKNFYRYKVALTIIDEIPLQFEKRDFGIITYANFNEDVVLNYSLRPVSRGKYIFGALHIFAKGLFRLCTRRYSVASESSFLVYPSIIQMRQYELQAISGKNLDAGIKRIRKIGNNREFDQIREYTAGDDVRTLNWKATARKGSLMVNQYQEEKSQPIYFIIDKGRTMKAAFEELTLLDYAINSTLAISNIALKKEDKVGLVTYNDKVNTFIPSEKKSGQFAKIIHDLYLQSTSFLESNLEALYVLVKSRIRQRSMLFLFINFESLSSFKRQQAILAKIAESHLLVLIFFENTEIKALQEQRSARLEDVYLRIAAEKLGYEKKMIQKELRQMGILSVLTTPQQLSLNVINKYLEIKSRQML